MNATVRGRSSSASTLVQSISSTPTEWAQVAAKLIGTHRVPGAAVITYSALSQSKFELINYPVEVLSALNHLDNKRSLEKLAMLLHILFKILIFATNSAEDLTVSHLDLHSLGAD